MFFFNDTATTEIYTLSLRDALPICQTWLDTRRELESAYSPGARRPYVLIVGGGQGGIALAARLKRLGVPALVDRKSTRLNSSHANISYAVFRLIKKHREPLDRAATE